MSLETARLERAAAEERERLGEHLNQLQHRLERALDPVAVFDRHPLPILAAALVGGVVLGAVTSKDGPSRQDDDRPRVRRRGSGQSTGFLHDGMAQLRGALVGMLFAKIAEKVQDAVSGQHGSPRGASRPATRPSRRERPAVAEAE